MTTKDALTVTIKPTKTEAMAELIDILAQWEGLKNLPEITDEQRGSIKFSAQYWVWKYGPVIVEEYMSGD